MPHPPFFEEFQRTKKQLWSKNSTANVIVFPSVPATPSVRKRGLSKVTEMKALIASGVPALIESVRLDIIAKWRRGVRISYIAKIHQLTVAQVEALLWVAYHQQPEPGDGNTAVTVRESRGLHLVARRAA